MKTDTHLTPALSPLRAERGREKPIGVSTNGFAHCLQKSDLGALAFTTALLRLEGERAGVRLVISYIVRQSIRYPGVIVALALTIVVCGLFTLSRAHLDVFPEFSPSQVVIQTEAPGLSAELVETQVSQPIENALSGVSGLESLRSQSIPGLSVVHVFFRDGSDIYRNRQVVSERLASLSTQLPNGIVPAMTPLTSSASTVLGIGITSDKRSLMELRTLVDWVIRPHLLAVRGVAEVNVFGGDVRQWQIQVDPEKLRRFGLALEDVVGAARRATGVAGAGFVKTPNQHILLQVDVQPDAVADVARSVLAFREGRALRIGDVAKVVEGAAPSIGAAAIDGTPGVFMMVQGQLGSNTHAVTQDLEAAVGRTQAACWRKRASNCIRSLFRPANFIETAVRNVQRDILIGSLLVVVVLFLFLLQRAHRIRLRHGDTGLAAGRGPGPCLFQRNAEHHGHGRAGDRAG